MQTLIVSLRGVEGRQISRLPTSFGRASALAAT